MIPKKKTPKWAQPLFGQHVCSICGDKEVFYERMEAWMESIETLEGITLFVENMAMKCWCEACYEEYGGKKDA